MRKAVDSYKDEVCMWAGVMLVVRRLLTLFTAFKEVGSILLYHLRLAEMHFMLLITTIYHSMLSRRYVLQRPTGVSLSRRRGAVGIPFLRITTFIISLSLPLLFPFPLCLSFFAGRLYLPEVVMSA